MAKLIGMIGAAKKFFTSKKSLVLTIGQSDPICIFLMNVVDIWLSYQGINETSENQADFYNYLSEEMMYNTYNRFMMRSEDGRRRNIVDYDDKTFYYYNPLFVRINGVPRCVIYLHVTPTKNRRKKKDGTETQYLLQGESKVFRKKTTHVCSYCVDTNAVQNEMWVYRLRKTVPVFAHHVHSTHNP